MKGGTQLWPTTHAYNFDSKPDHSRILVWQQAWEVGRKVIAFWDPSELAQLWVPTNKTEAGPCQHCTKIHSQIHCTCRSGRSSMPRYGTKYSMRTMACTARHSLAKPPVGMESSCDRPIKTLEALCALLHISLLCTHAPCAINILCIKAESIGDISKSIGDIILCTNAWRVTYRRSSDPSYFQSASDNQV